MALSAQAVSTDQADPGTPVVPATDLRHSDTAAAVEAGWHPVCGADELEPAWPEAALVADRQIALVMLAPDEVYAVDHRDPKTSSYVMARGIVGSRGDRPTIASPLLKQVYDLQTGACLDDPALALATYRTRIVGGMVEVEVIG
jgi:nitrite reductase (NADH) small subunit